MIGTDRCVVGRHQDTRAHRGGTAARDDARRGVGGEWGVAMATATKALSVLRAEGLAVSVPGVGTVVTERGPRLAARGSRPPGRARR
ncbi:hypothetical protein [Streptomyces sp. NPDC088726]|uniref:hypothetical protein n=1 Tax=Streptomyces sp. NPDC088726 TaxID=3365874 RepID=UPI0038028D75